MEKVLIVEDDPMVALINRRYLESIGNVEVFGPVTRPDELFAVLEQEDIDLILLDAYLPQKSGFEILKMLRKKEYYTNVIMITAANTNKEVKQAYAYGVVDYLMKPFDINRFKMAFEKHLAISNILEKKEVLEQSDLDKEVTLENKVELPKGLNPITMKRIGDKLKENPNKVWTIRELAKEICISNVTIKKYLDYLE